MGIDLRNWKGTTMFEHIEGVLGHLDREYPNEPKVERGYDPLYEDEESEDIMDQMNCVSLDSVKNAGYMLEEKLVDTIDSSVFWDTERSDMTEFIDSILMGGC